MYELQNYGKSKFQCEFNTESRPSMIKKYNLANYMYITYNI